MRNLSGHGCPGLVPLAHRKLRGGVVKVMHHQVVGTDQLRNLVIPVVDDIFKVLDACLIHLSTHLRQRLEHLVDSGSGDESCKKEKDHEHCDNRNRMEQGLHLEVEAVIGVW